MKKWKCLLFGLDDSDQIEITLPFVPFPNLWIRDPRLDLDYMLIDEVYWQDDENRFHIYLKDS
jgi:hypothetical protein